MNKKILLVLIILALIIIGAGIYFWLTGGTAEWTSAVRQTDTDSIPQPPALPE